MIRLSNSLADEHLLHHFLLLRLFHVITCCCFDDTLMRMLFYFDNQVYLSGHNLIVSLAQIWRPIQNYNRRVDLVTAANHVQGLFNVLNRNSLNN
uniref:Tick transposon n=1 Tax=Rhipicephalus appendiculatus TaxID=34631 RepID=A0A131YDW2_RHIAP